MCNALTQRCKDVIRKAGDIIDEIEKDTTGLKSQFESPLETLSFRRECLQVCTHLDVGTASGPDQARAAEHESALKTFRQKSDNQTKIAASEPIADFVDFKSLSRVLKEMVTYTFNSDESMRDEKKNQRFARQVQSIGDKRVFRNKQADQQLECKKNEEAGRGLDGHRRGCKER